MARTAHGPLACVLGSMDLVRPLGLAGIRCAVVARPAGRVRYSRFTDAVVEWADPWRRPDELLRRLLDFGTRQDERPVLYYEGDWDLLLVARERDRLRQAFRFVVGDPELVESLVDKERFRALADRLGLPVPRSRRLTADSAPADLDLRFPVVVKPLTRQTSTWEPVAGGGKAVRVDEPRALTQLWERLAVDGTEVLAQELVPGPETLIESYHVYIDERGEIAGEFAGRKLRTHPAEYGFTSALEITDDSAVIELGRELLARLRFRGVAKLDFKRAPDGGLRLLEVNPRFNLWHHPGAKAGVNLPALVYADLVGLPRPPAAKARAGVRWCNVTRDARARRTAGVPLRSWLRWVAACEAKSGLALDDPMPALQGTLARLAHRRLHAARGGGA